MNVPNPAGPRPERARPGREPKRLASGLVAGPALPRAPRPGDASGWPADVRLPDDAEDREC